MDDFINRLAEVSPDLSRWAAREMANGRTVGSVKGAIRRAIQSVEIERQQDDRLAA